MKKFVFTYLALILILSSILTSPLSIVAAEVTNDDETKQLETTIEEAEKAAAEEAEKAAAAEAEKAAAAEAEKAAAEEEKAAEERHGFTLGIKNALNIDNQKITVENAIEAEETFILELNGHLASDHNYRAEDKVKFNLPAGVTPSESVNDKVMTGNSAVANYTINNNGVVEVEFLEAAEAVSNKNMALQVKVNFNTDYIEKSAEEAVINPIADEAALIVPIAVEEKQGFALNINDALNTDNEKITVENAIEAEETFILEMNGHLSADHNYEANDKVTYNLPDSVITAEAVSDKVTAGDSEVGNYTINNNGVVEVEFSESAEAVSNEDMVMQVPVNFNTDMIEENAEEAVINPIAEEAALVVPLAVDEEIATAAADGEHFLLEIDSFLDMSEDEISEENANLPGLDDEFVVRLNWELVDGHDYKDGDTVTFNIPDALNIFTATEGTLTTPEGEDVVDFVVNMDGTVEFTFLKAVEDLSQVRGYLNIYTSIDSENAEVENGEVIVSPIGNEGEKRFPVNLSEKEKTIEKIGEPNTSYNANELNWEVTINRDRQSLTNAAVSDVLPEGTEYLDGSLKVTELNVDLEGNIIGEGEEISITPSVSGNTLNIPFGDINKAYKIEYVTTVTDDEVSEFNNNATLTDNELEDVSAGATITVRRGEPLNKSFESYDAVTGEVTWKIDFNFNGKDLQDVTLNDSWSPEGALNLVEDSMVFTQMAIDAEGNATETGVVGLPEGASINSLSDGFEITNITTDQPYRITYKTKVNSRVIEDLKIDNTASFDGNTSTAGTTVGQVAGVKSSPSVNHQTKKIDWRINVNSDQHHMENISITDTLSEGVTLDPDTVNVTVGGADYTEFTISGDTPFTINFPDGFETSEEIIINYTSDYDPNIMPDLTAKNTAVIAWDDEGGNSHSINVNADRRINDMAADSNMKQGTLDLANKEIDWRIFVNYNQNNYENLSITDSPQGNQTLVEDSIRIHNWTIDQNGNHRIGADVTGDFPGAVSVDGKDFNVNLGETNKAYVIQYSTSYAGLSDVQAEYINDATILNGTEELDKLSARVGVTNYNSYASKSGVQNGLKMDWSVNVNSGQQLVNGLTLTDTLSDNQEYLEDSIVVYNANYNGNNLTKGEILDTDSYALNVSDDGQSMTINWNDGVERAFIVEYSSLFFAGHNEEVNNSYKVTGDVPFAEDADSDGTVTQRIVSRSTGGAEGTAGYLVIEKIDSTNGGDTPLAGAEFELRNPDTGAVLKSGTTGEDGLIDFGRLLYGEYLLVETGIPEGYITDEESRVITINKPYNAATDIMEYAVTVENYVPVFAVNLLKTDDLNVPVEGVEFALYDSEDNEVATGTTDVDGRISFTDLPDPGTYYLEETSVPAGYEISEERHEVTVGERENAAADITVVNDRLTTSVAGQKTWEDGDNQDGNRPDSITVNLFADEEQLESVLVTADNDWTYSFDDLPTHKNGQEIEYTITEDTVEGYETTVDGFNLTNTYTPEVITVNLFANGEQIDSAEVSGSGTNWAYSFTDLPRYNNGEEIVYTVEEAAVEGYKTSIDGYIITNTYVPELTEVSVSKVWEDKENQDGVRPNNVTVNLLNGSEIETSVVLNDANNWQHTFNDLPKYADGEEIQYSVTENTVAEYSTSIETTETDTGLNSVVTNTYTPEETTATVTKVWNDGSNQDGNRPGSVSVQLLADGEAYGEPVEVTAEDNWSYTWTGLDLKANGEAIAYTVEELEVNEDYEVSLNNDDHGNLVITNAYTLQVTEVSVAKEWDDADDQDGARPENVTINLLADGEVVKTTIVDTESEWQHTFTDLPVYNKGNEINYTVTENAVTDYTADIVKNPDAANEFVITNSHTPNETSVTITKSWNDANNQDSNRPNSILVQLNSVNGDELVPVGDPVEVFAAEDWTYTWTGLDENEDGQAIKYTVEELNVSEDYTVAINDADHGNIILTNSYTPETTEVPVTKVWDDAVNQDGERPSNITLNLLNNRGEIVKQAVVQGQESNEWNYVFTDLPKFENGTEINYSVTENFVSDYSTETENSEDGIVITNTLTPDETSVTVTKGWNDSNNQDNVRPDSIEVQLNANGEAVGEPVVITAADNWTYTWSGLDLNADGEAIDYTVEELNVPEGYEALINDSNHGNIIITNTYEPELIEIPVQKVWDDRDNQDGIRPDRVEVNLLADGEKIKEAHITEAADWQHVFTDLPKFKAGQEGQEVVYTLTENSIEDYSLTDNEINEETGKHELTNSYTPEETHVTATKNWNDAENQENDRPEAIEFQLLRTVDGELEEVGRSVEVSAENNWTHTWDGLDKYSDGELIEYTVQEIIDEEYGTYDITVNDDEEGNIIITNTRAYETEHTIVKGWTDGENQDGLRPDLINVQLLQNKEPLGEPVAVTEENNWIHTWENLEKYDSNNEAYTYEAIEIEVPEGYDAEVNLDDQYPNTSFITNVYEPAVIDIAGEKIWEDGNNQDNVRPNSIQVNLLANGEQVKTTAVDNSTDWSYSFEDLPEYSEGNVIEYTVEEESVENYSTSIDGYKITNTYGPALTEVAVSKVWDDQENQDNVRPNNVTVDLLNGSEIVTQVVLSEENDWQYVFTELPRFDNGEEIQYSVAEKTVMNYSTSIDSNASEEGIESVITNSYTPGETSASVTKLWNDNNNQDGTRTESISVQLLAEGEPEGNPVEVTAENNWTYTWSGLDSNNGGTAITYTVEELDVPEGYEVSVNNDDHGNMVITNTYVPETTEVAVSKAWNDENNQDKTRPENVTVNLLNNSEIVKQVVLSEDNDWQHVFTDLPKYDKSEEIEYRVTENTVAGYTPSIETKATDKGFNSIVTNSYTPEKTGVTVSKVWKDENDKDGNRPDSISVQLLANGEPHGEPAEVTAENNWIYTWNELDLNVNGEAIVYTVEEVNVPEGYTGFSK